MNDFNQDGKSFIAFLTTLLCNHITFFHQTVKIKGGFQQKKYEFAKLPRWFKRNSASKQQLCKNGVIWEEGFGTENEWDSFMTLNSTKILLCSPTILPYKNKAETQCGKKRRIQLNNISWNQFAVCYDSCQWRHKQFCFGGAKHTLAPFCQILVGLI